MLRYKYYDTPEGHDIFLKTFVTSKYAALTGLGAATFDVLMFSHPKGIVNTAGRFMWYIGPLVGMAAAFSVTTNVAQNIRGKNDKVNYFLGGASAGAIFGAWQKSGTIGVPMAVVLGLVAVIKKTAIDEGWELMPQVPHATKTIQSVRRDWSVAKDIEELKTFTTGSFILNLFSFSLTKLGFSLKKIVRDSFNHRLLTFYVIFLPLLQVSNIKVKITQLYQGFSKNKLTF